MLKNLVNGAAILLVVAASLSGCKGRNGQYICTVGPVLSSDTTLKVITIDKVCCDFDREPLKRKFGFKGGYVSEIWNVSAYMSSTSGQHAIGLGLQSVLWSDASVFFSNSETGGSTIMYSMTQYALKLAKGKSFRTPVELMEWLFPQVWAYGKQVSANPNLRATFALNSLVSVDNAAWVLFAKENGFTTFDEMIPPEYRPALKERHSMCAAIPLITYAVPVEEVKAAAEEGYFFMKIKIGQAGSQEEMLQKDMARVSEIHEALKDIRTPYTESGRIPYYFDANGRYESKETLLKFIEHLKTIGAYDQVAIIEEPFDEYADIDVSDIPLRLAADESAHTVADARKRMDMGYRAMALKPIAKTLSMSLMIAKAAYDRGVPCFCADLTVPPVMVEWNKAVAARLPSFPGIGDLGLVETNGHQNYVNWETMRQDLADPNASWSRVEGGVFKLDDDYWMRSGGILEPIRRLEEKYARIIQ